MVNPIKNKALSAQVASQLAPFSRRSFIKAGIGVAVSSSSLLTLGCSSEPAIDSSLSALTASQQKLFSRLISLLLPTSGTDMTAVETVPVLGNINHLFASLESKVLGDLSGATTLFEYGAVLLGGEWSRFTKLSDAAALSYIEDWQNGNTIQRGIATTLKKMVYASYWRDESTWAPLDYDGPVSVRWGLPSLGNAPLPAE